ncbi:MAG: hypothetical protein QJR03_14470 [Sphaerobacter sp.]|nr:hypothetical protein [Sphaerobacter sp.]
MAIAVLLAACSAPGLGGSGDSAGAADNPARQPVERGPDLAPFDPALFDENSATIDNEWWPLTPGTQLVLEGTTTEAGEQISHRFVVTVTDLTKEIAGIRTRVLFDRDYSDGQLIEAELALFAQDRDGNVWHFGQYVEEWDETGFIGAHAWLQGYLEDAHAGIMVPANPQLNMPDYSQGFAPDPIT